MDYADEQLYTTESDLLAYEGPIETARI